VPVARRCEHQVGSSFEREQVRMRCRLAAVLLQRQCEGFVAG